MQERLLALLSFVPGPASVRRLLRLFVALPLLLCACGGESTAPSGENGTSDPAPSPSEKTVRPAHDPPEKPPLEQRTYGGETIASWRGRIKDLDPKGPDGIAAVDGLIELVRDEDVPLELRRWAAITLGRIGRPAERSVPAFVAILQKPYPAGDAGADAEVRFSLKALERLGPASRSATGLLAGIFRDPKRPLPHRAGALEALAQIGSAEPKAVQTVIGALTRRRQFGESRHDYQLLRRLAADAMAIIGPDASAGIRNLIVCTRDSDEGLRRKAALALGAMKLRGRDAVVPLAELLVRDESPAVRDAAADGMALLGTPALPALRKLIKDEDVEVRRRAALALGKIGPPAQAALPDLDYTLDDKDGWTRINAAEAIWRVSGKTASPVAAFVEELKNPDRQVRMKAYRLFKELGPKLAPKAKKIAEIALERLQKDDRGYVRSAAANALRAIRTPH